MKFAILISSFLFSLNTFAQSIKEKVDGITLYAQSTYYSKSLQQKETAVSDYIGFYQKYISGIRGQECPMYPSCSNYGLKVFRETNFANAFALTSERLLRCGHEHKNYNLTLRPTGLKLLDYPPYDVAPKELLFGQNRLYYSFSDTITDRNKQLAFIKSLINKQYYHEALLEIKRFQFSPDQEVDAELLVNELICLKGLGEYENAIYEYEVNYPPKVKANTEVLFQVSTLHYKLENFEKSLEYVDKALKTASNDAKIKLYALQGINHAKLSAWKPAIESFQKRASLSDNPSEDSIRVNYLNKALNFKRKSPAKAAVLSIIPGLGYAYTGHKQTGITAFVINGLLGYATYTSFRTKNYGIGILTGIFNVSFYIGNITGSANSAKRYNTNQQQTIIKRVENKFTF